MRNTNTVRVKMWGSTVGYLHQEDNGIVGFQYDEDFIGSGIGISPIKMPLSNLTYSFPALPEQTFHGLPGMVADSLPDKFGTIVINKYLDSPTYPHANPCIPKNKNVILPTYQERHKSLRIFKVSRVY